MHKQVTREYITQESRIVGKLPSFLKEITSYSTDHQHQTIGFWFTAIINFPCSGICLNVEFVAEINLDARFNHIQRIKINAIKINCTIDLKQMGVNSISQLVNNYTRELMVEEVTSFYLPILSSLQTIKLSVWQLYREKVRRIRTKKVWILWIYDWLPCWLPITWLHQSLEHN